MLPVRPISKSLHSFGISELGKGHKSLVTVLSFPASSISPSLSLPLSSLSYFERSYQLNNSCHASLSTAIYLRQFIAKWGPHGSQYYADNQATIQLIQEELHMVPSPPPSPLPLSVLIAPVYLDDSWRMLLMLELSQFILTWLSVLLFVLSLSLSGSCPLPLSFVRLPHPSRTQTPDRSITCCFRKSSCSPID
jgi:hypothetical protein